MPLRDYQLSLVDGAREILRSSRSCLIQLPTGAGKTPVVAEITRAAFSREFRVWFVVPRNELLMQGSEHFAKWGVPHGFISAGREESRAYRVHVVSKDTLLRRLDRIKNWPDLIIFDEAHLYYDAQLKIIEHLPERCRVIGMTATPERLDGRGLSDIYGGIVYGPSIPELTRVGFLSPLRYFAPPIEGLDKVHRKGTEYDAHELEALLEKRKIYGDVVNYYQKYGTINHSGRSFPDQPTARSNTDYHKGKPALIFTRSVKSAYETAERFTQAGFLFFCIEGNMPQERRKALIEALRKGEIDGLTNCEIATYGLDVPRVEYGASIRPTLSRALYFQKVGRLLRPFPGKEEALFFDHANLVEEHSEPLAPGVPLFYLENITWNFEGREVRKREKIGAPIRLCPARDYMYCDDPGCARGCKLDPNAALNPRGSLEVIDAPLVERTAKAALRDYPPDERSAIEKRIATATAEFIHAAEADPTHIESGPVGALLQIADELGYAPMWVYWRLMPRAAGIVNVPLLHEIARQKEYKPGWAWWKRKQIRDGIREGAEKSESKQ